MCKALARSVTPPPKPHLSPGTGLYCEPRKRRFGRPVVRCGRPGEAALTNSAPTTTELQSRTPLKAQLKLSFQRTILAPARHSTPSRHSPSFDPRSCIAVRPRMIPLHAPDPLELQPEGLLPSPGRPLAPARRLKGHSLSVSLLPRVSRTGAVPPAFARAATVTARNNRRPRSPVFLALYCGYSVESPRSGHLMVTKIRPGNDSGLSVNGLPHLCLAARVTFVVNRT